MLDVHRSNIPDVSSMPTQGSLVVVTCDETVDLGRVQQSQVSTVVACFSQLESSGRLLIALLNRRVHFLVKFLVELQDILVLDVGQLVH
jgi:hypothetical protein